MREQTFLRPLILANGGFLVWALHFTVLYGFTSLACTRGLAERPFGSIGLVAFFVALATILAIAGVAFIALAAFAGARRQQDRTAYFLRALTLTVAGFSLVAIVWQAVPVFIVPSCA